jgi:hypothetical protein
MPGSTKKIKNKTQELRRGDLESAVNGIDAKYGTLMPGSTKKIKNKTQEVVSNLQILTPEDLIPIDCGLQNSTPDKISCFDRDDKP